MRIQIGSIQLVHRCLWDYGGSCGAWNLKFKLEHQPPVPAEVDGSLRHPWLHLKLFSSFNAEEARQQRIAEDEPVCCMPSWQPTPYQPHEEEGLLAREPWMPCFKVTHPSQGLRW